MKIILTDTENKEYIKLKLKDTAKKKRWYNQHFHCPVCGYVVDDGIMKQNYCDNCGQRLEKTVF